MIHLFLGTKAQYVKMAPIVRELDQRRIRYNLVDSGQHAKLGGQYRRYFGIREPDCSLGRSGRDVVSASQLLQWALPVCWAVAVRPKKFHRRVFLGEKGLCLIHGDTPTTLLSAFAAKRCGLRVAHIESGLRSFHFLQPFPEEIIRFVTMHLADYLFAPSTWAYDNLKRMRLRGKAFLVPGNTNRDAIQMLTEHSEGSLPDGLERQRYVVVSIHRAETILVRKRLRLIVDLCQEICRTWRVLFCVHPPTRRQLAKFNFIQILEHEPQLMIQDLLPYPDFVRALRQAAFVVTDGGSIQEECYYLNVPCLLMRNRTERLEGLGGNVLLSRFDDEVIHHFLRHWSSFRTSPLKNDDRSPTREIVDIILSEM